MWYFTLLLLLLLYLLYFYKNIYKTVREKVATTRTADGHRLPKQALKYRPKRRRNIGRPRKRWRDQIHFEDQGTGNTHNPSRT
jgi:hypothetical protein